MKETSFGETFQIHSENVKWVVDGLVVVTATVGDTEWAAAGGVVSALQALVAEAVAQTGARRARPVALG